MRAVRVFAISAAGLLSIAPALYGQALTIIRPVVSQSEDGPALERGTAFQPGDIAFFSFQAENYKVSPDGKVKLTGHISAFDPSGKLIQPPEEEVIGTSVSEEDKNWKPKIRVQLQLPSIAPPGAYKIIFDVADQQSKQTAKGELTFPVGGKGVEPSPVLAFRNLGFYRTQEEETPLKVVAYRAGDLLWVRFDLTGYKYGEQNSIDVTYDVAVLAPDGKQLFTQEDAAVERSQAFYPQPWIPATFNLSLQSTMRPGTYTLVLTAHDAVGKQTATERAQFRVE
jgi:hypothetical protein